MEDRQTDRPTDRPTDLGIKAPSRSLKSDVKYRASQNTGKNKNTLFWPILMKIVTITKMSSYIKVIKKANLHKKTYKPNLPINE